MTSTFLYGGNVNANGIRQHYLRYGGDTDGRNKRETIIIIPGITSPAITWGFVGEQFGQHYDTYILDVRGRGLSSASDDLDYSLDAQASDVISFAQAMGLSSYSLVGHSMGARIAIRAAVQQPQGLHSMVLIDPPVSGPNRRAYPSKLPWYIDSIRMAVKGCTAEQMREYCATWTEEQLLLRAEWLHTCNERAILTSFEGFHTDDVHQYLSAIHIPTMLMVAGRGGVILEEDESEFKSLMPQLVITKVDNAGHMIPWDDEQGFYKAFGTFLGVAI